MMNRLWPPFMCLLLAACQPGGQKSQAGEEVAVGDPTQAPLLEYGWDMPNPGQLKRAEARLDASPFDGLTLRLSAGQIVFTPEPLGAASVDADLKTLSTVQSPKLRASLLSVYGGATEGWDWFDDRTWAATGASLRQIGRVVREAGLRGVALDMEPYELNPWDYAAQPGAGAHDFAASQAKVRTRGAAYMRALQTEAPGLTVYALYLLMGVADELDGDPSPDHLQQRLKQSTSGLWPAFVNGMLDAADPDVRFVEGNEPAYYHLKAEQFDAAQDFVQTALLPLVAPENRQKYARQVSTGQAVYADGVMNLHASPRFCGYFFKDDAERAQMLEHNVYHALRTARPGAWFYSEKVNWWGTKSGTPQVPTAVLESVREARRKLDAGQALNLDLGFVEPALAACSARVNVGGDQGVSGVRFAVNGEVRDPDADPNCATWNAARRYSCTFPGGWSGTVAPVAAGRTFDPPERRYQNLTGDDWKAHFTAKP